MPDLIPPPSIGSVYVGKGGAREVREVLPAGRVYEVVWGRPGRPATHRCWYSTWAEWARTATLSPQDAP